MYPTNNQPLNCYLLPKNSAEIDKHKEKLNLIMNDLQQLCRIGSSTANPDTPKLVAEKLKLLCGEWGFVEFCDRNLILNFADQDTLNSVKELVTDLFTKYNSNAYKKVETELQFPRNENALVLNEFQSALLTGVGVKGLEDTTAVSRSIYILSQADLFLNKQKTDVINRFREIVSINLIEKKAYINIFNSSIGLQKMLEELVTSKAISRDYAFITHYSAGKHFITYSGRRGKGKTCYDANQTIFHEIVQNFKPLKVVFGKNEEKIYDIYTSALTGNVQNTYPNLCGFSDFMTIGGKDEGYNIKFYFKYLLSSSKYEGMEEALSSLNFPKFEKSQIYITDNLSVLTLNKEQTKILLGNNLDLLSKMYEFHHNHYLKKINKDNLGIEVVCRGDVYQLQINYSDEDFKNLLNPSLENWQTEPGKTHIRYRAQESSKMITGAPCFFYAGQEILKEIKLLQKNELK